MSRSTAAAAATGNLRLYAASSPSLCQLAGCWRIGHRPGGRVLRVVQHEMVHSWLEHDRRWLMILDAAKIPSDVERTASGAVIMLCANKALDRPGRGREGGAQAEASYGVVAVPQLRVDTQIPVLYPREQRQSGPRKKQQPRRLISLDLFACFCDVQEVVTQGAPRRTLTV